MIDSTFKLLNFKFLLILKEKLFSELNSIFLISISLDKLVKIDFNSSISNFLLLVKSFPLTKKEFLFFFYLN